MCSQNTRTHALQFCKQQANTKCYQKKGPTMSPENGPLQTEMAIHLYA